MIPRWLPTVFFLAAVQSMQADGEIPIRQALAGPDISPRHSMPPPPRLEIVEWQGSVACDDQPEPGEPCDLRFTREPDGDEFSIAIPGKLAELEWGSGVSRRVRLRAKRTPKFLFWGNELVVIDFWMLDENAGREEGEKKREAPSAPPAGS